MVSLLTLENTDKMTGVLSESDIKILERAGSRLGNLRISPASARRELMKIAGIADGGTLMEDANGNQAIVYPDGRVEEL